MNSESRNLILAIVLSGIVLVVWQVFFVFPQQQEQLAEQARLEELAKTTQSEQETSAGLTEGEAIIDQELIDNSASLINDISAQRVDIAIDSEKLLGNINAVGAKIDSLILTQYRDTISPQSDNVRLLNPSDSSSPYYASFGWSGDTPTPNLNTVWQAYGEKLTPGESITLRWENENSQIFEQVITLDSNYMFNVTQRVENRSNTAINLTAYGIIARKGTPDITGIYILHEGLIGMLDGSIEEIDYEDIIEQKQLSGSTKDGWIGITDKYWLTALIPEYSLESEGKYRWADRSGVDYYQADVTYEPIRIAPAQTYEWKSRFFAGAKQVTMLDDYVDEGIPLFDRAIDFGWLYFLTKPLFLLLDWIGKQVGNIGVAIICLTIIVRLAMFPLANKSFVSMSKMKKLAPDIKIIRERYADDRQKISQEMMSLYRREKVNPLSGCLPILVQIPVFFALYKVFYVTIEMRHAPFFGWIKDLSAPDPAGILFLFGLVEWDIPRIFLALNVGIWPILMGLTMWLQQKLNPTPPDPMQKRIFAFLPFVFTFLLGSMPAGLVMYWTFSNLFSIAQQWLIMRKMNVKIG